MTENPLKVKLARGQPVLGIWSIIPSPMVVEILGQAGLDFQILDMEHGVFDLGTLENCVRACEAAGCSPLVRVPGWNPFTIQSVLDLGAHGILVPQICDEQTARAAVCGTKFAPTGTRGYNPFTRAALYNPSSTAQVGKLHNSFGLAGVIVENESAYQALDAILGITDLDMIYLGVYDMSLALGCQGDVAHPRVQAFVEHSARNIRRAGKAVGMMVKSRSEIDKALRLGANVLAYAVDTHLIYRAGSEAVSFLREALQAGKGF
jgi:4-hydroxy-2-oxoheptanedioate aldolase